MPSSPSTQYVQKASEYRKACPNSAVAASVKARKPSTSAHDDCSNDENNFRASFPLIRHLHLRQSPHKPRIQGWSANAKVPNGDIADVERGQWRIATEKNDMLWHVIIKARINNIHKAKLKELKTRNWHRNRRPEHRNPKPTRIRLPRELCGSRLLTRNRKQNGPKIFATYQCPSWGLARFDISPALFLFMKVP